MTLFEVMAALSATFALGIPTFMEKVMRPKYEERFSEFREARRDSFIDEFEKALPQLKQAKQELTPEIIETMESLFNEWEEVKSDENKLTVLLNCRKFFFIFWLVSCATSLFAIQYSNRSGRVNIRLIRTRNHTQNQTHLIFQFGMQKNKVLPPLFIQSHLSVIENHNQHQQP
ncbi:MAG: hypothetical protein WHU54_02610 [Candidatus Bathyarchaeia archaeon]|jgi:hypothetical protein